VTFENMNLQISEMKKSLIKINKTNESETIDIFEKVRQLKNKKDSENNNNDRDTNNLDNRD